MKILQFLSRGKIEECLTWFQNISVLSAINTSKLSHALNKIFLTCYFCLCYSSMWEPFLLEPQKELTSSARSCYVLQVVLFTVLCFKWSVKKHCEAKTLQGIRETFLYESNCNYNSYKFSYKFAAISFLSFSRNQRQESNFKQVGRLVTRTIYVFLFMASCALFQRYAEFMGLLFLLIL